MRHGRNLMLCFLLVICPYFSTNATASIVSYDEDVSGDLSNDPGNPTNLPNLLNPLSVGTHTISGRALNASDVLADPEYWSFLIGANTAVTSIKFTEYDNESYEDKGNGGFFGVAAASTITANHGSQGNLLGAALVGVQPGTAVNEELMDDLREPFNFGPFNISGFSGGLGEGTYSFWFQEGNPTQDTPPEGGGPGPNDKEDFVDYTFQIQVSAVPEPSSMIIFLMIGGIGCLSGASRRRN